MKAVDDSLMLSRSLVHLLFVLLQQILMCTTALAQILLRDCRTTKMAMGQGTENERMVGPRVTAWDAPV